MDADTGADFFPAKAPLPARRRDERASHDEAEENGR